MNETTTLSQNALYHHGVKGMKWGVRNKRSVSDRKRRSSSANQTKLQRSIKKGKQRTKRLLTESRAKTLATTTAVLAGSLYLAQAFMTGTPTAYLSSAAFVSNIVGGQLSKVKDDEYSD